MWRRAAAYIETAEFRPVQQRRGRRRPSLLRHPSDSQVRLQVTADRAASKHIGSSRNHGKAGPPTDPAKGPGGRRRRDARVWRDAGSVPSGEGDLLRACRGYRPARPRVSIASKRSQLVAGRVPADCHIVSIGRVWLEVRGMVGSLLHCAHWSRCVVGRMPGECRHLQWPRCRRGKASQRRNR